MDEHRGRLYNDSSDDLLSDGPLGRRPDQISYALVFCRAETSGLGWREGASLENGGAGGNNSWPEIGDNTALDEKSVAFVCVQRTPRSTQDVSSAAF